MKEIKFRVWTGNSMEYNVVAGKFGTFYVNPENGDGLDKNDSASLTTANTKYPDDIPVMQYSGINDRDGKDIYDGDLFKLGAEKDIYEVRFEHGCFLAYKKDVQFGLIGELKIMFIKVIGNIYENSELF